MPARRSLVVRAPAELDALTARGFRDELGELLVTGADTLVVDMSDVVFLDSSGMGALVAVQRLASQHNVSLLLRGVKPKVRSSLRLAGLLEVLHVQPEE